MTFLKMGIQIFIFGLIMIFCMVVGVKVCDYFFDKFDKAIELPKIFKKKNDNTIRPLSNLDIAQAEIIRKLRDYIETLKKIIREQENTILELGNELAAKEQIDNQKNVKRNDTNE